MLCSWTYGTAWCTALLGTLVGCTSSHGWPSTTPTVRVLLLACSLVHREGICETAILTTDGHNFVSISTSVLRIASRLNLSCDVHRLLLPVPDANTSNMKLHAC